MIPRKGVSEKAFSAEWGMTSRGGMEEGRVGVFQL
jgi:hypothetical protein